jgi:hypothetical protein
MEMCGDTPDLPFFQGMNQGKFKRQIEPLMDADHAEIRFLPICARVTQRLTSKLLIRN